ncbi:MAG: LysR substrate-binding domain-containing protein [Cyanobacteria bacterium J06598_3]
MNLPMNLRQLRYFLAVADELHFGRAAKRLNMAQPPLSAQIKQLETNLGVLLFERTKRRVNLTAAGKVLQQEAQQVLMAVEIAAHKTQQAGLGERGRVSVAFVSSAMYSILPPWLSAFSQQYPAVELVLQEATVIEQVEGLLAHRIDIGFVRPPIMHPLAAEKIARKTVLQEPLLASLPKTHRLSAAEKVTLAELAPEGFIFIPRHLATDMHDKIISFCAQANFSPRVVQTADQLQTVLGLVAAQIGIAILPAAAQKLQREGVCYRQFAEAAPTTEVVMIWRNHESSAILENFLAVQPDS